MRIYQKKKYSNGKREIYICGIRVYSYTKNKMELTNFDFTEQARNIGVKIGEGSYVCSNIIWGSEPYLIEIGKNCLLSLNITFLTHNCSTHTCEQYFTKSCFKATLGRIKIGDNCFIGCQSIIMPNVVIGNNCVIGAGSVVTKNVPDGEVWAGNPAHFIKKTKDLAKKQEVLLHSKLQIELQNIYKDVESTR